MSVMLVCAPACVILPAKPLQSNDAAVYVPAGTGPTPPVPVYETINQIMCEPAPSSAKVMVVSTTLETAPPGTVPTVAYYNFPAMTTYTGNAATLISCGGDGSVTFQGCSNGVPTTKWVVTEGGRPTSVVYYTDVATNAVVTPSAWVDGPCAVATVVTKPAAFDGSFKVFTDADLPAIAAGGILTGIEIWNRGKGKLFFTGADGNTVTYGPIDGPQWNPDSPPGSMGHFKIDATSTNCMVNYTFR